MMINDLFATEPALAALAGADSVALVTSSGGERVLAGTDSGERAFGVASGPVPRALGEQIARFAGQVSFTAPRLVRLRLGGLRPVTVRAQRARLADGTGVLLLVALDAQVPRRSAAAPAPVSRPEPAAPAVEDSIVPPREIVVPAATVPVADAPGEDISGTAPAVAETTAEPSVAGPVEQQPGFDLAPPTSGEAELPVHQPDESQETSSGLAAVDPDAAMDVSAPEEADEPEDAPHQPGAPDAEVEAEAEPAALSPAPAPEPAATSAVNEVATAEPAAPAAGRPLRFVWQTDESGILSLVSPEFAAAVESDVDNLVGRSWLDLATELGFDQEDRLSRVLGRQDTWSGVTIDWPLGGNRRLPVDLAGLPVFDRERVFRGFRGFGVCREPYVSDVAPPRDEQVEPQTAAVPEPTPEPARVQRATVVPFPEPRDPSRPPLSNNERQAFREIARALGAPGADKPTAPRIAFTRRAPAPSPAPVQTLTQPGAPAASSADRPAPAAPPPLSVDRSEPLPTPPGRSDQEALLDAVPFAVLVHRAGQPIYMNRAFRELTGFTSLDLLAGAGVDTLFEEHGLLNADGARSPGVRLRRADGTCIAVEGHLKQVLWNEDPATLLTFRVMEDVTLAGPAASPELADQVRELSAILDTATDGIVVLDGEGRILSINRSAEALFGYESAELSGRSLTLLLSTDSHATALDYLEGLRANGVALLLNDGRHVTGVARRGGSIPLFMTLGRLDEAGAKFCAVLRDITQFKKAEEELRASKNHAENTSAQKSDFLARVSHEIRTPLNAIIGFAEVMMEERFGPVGNDRYRDYLKDIHTSGQHVISLVNDLLDLSKIEAGRLDLSFTSLQLNDVVTTAVGLMQPQANNAKVIVRTSLAAKLPSVVADERSIRQIALNLLSNAIKFTPAGGQVIISTALTDLGQAVIRVRDTGIGMNDKDIQAALEPFRQIASASRGEGTGLGLPLTKALTEANRATFAIQSAAGSGTLVEVIFPPTRVLAE
jgi:PAS domain S-box-containing protein